MDGRTGSVAPHGGGGAGAEGTIRRSLLALMLFVGLVSQGCAGSQPSVVIYTPPPAAASLQPTPIPSPTAAPVPSLTPKSTPTPKPTLRPASLTFGDLSYNAAGCFSSQYRDSEGHAISGVKVDFSVVVKNTGQVKSQPVAFDIASTDWFSSNPTLLGKASWGVATFSRTDDKSMSLDGPQIGPGKSTTLRWSVLFQTPFAVHYTVDVGSSPHWSMWTSVQVCF